MGAALADAAGAPGIVPADVEESEKEERSGPDWKTNGDREKR